MLIARVIGELVSSQKHPSHDGRKALIVQPLHLDGSDRGDAVVALDSVDAGVGDRVMLVTEGYSAMTEEGRPGREFFILVEGAVAVRRSGRRVAELGPGGWFGEIALLTYTPRTATVTTTSPVRLLVISDRAFRRVVETTPRIAVKVLRNVAERLEHDARS